MEAYLNTTATVSLLDENRQPTPGRSLTRGSTHNDIRAVIRVLLDGNNSCNMNVDAKYGLWERQKMVCEVEDDGDGNRDGNYEDGGDEEEG